MQETRKQAIELVNAFIPNMGKRYESGRNYDHGPGRHHAVSLLSPYVSRRLITEQELVSEALNAHGPDKAFKFIEEVFWRTYFKGWLELRPTIWSDYVVDLQGDLAVLQKDKRLRAGYSAAIAGETGIECFDAWSAELQESGYLHNHARMWFASIWIFTLKLPWRLGADFFYRHLLDGDAASNTLSWRWVAGLHTRGKPYAARADNIATYSGGRFTPGHNDLAEVTEGLEASEPEGLPAAGKPRAYQEPLPGVPSVLLLTTEDACVQDFDLSQFDIRKVITLSVSDLRSPLAVSDAVVQFDQNALDDTAKRAGFEAIHTTPDTLDDALKAAGLKQIITPYMTQGPLYDLLTKGQKQLGQQGFQLTELKREWDTLVWPHAKAGFFRVKKQIPAVLSALVS